VPGPYVSTNYLDNKDAPIDKGVWVADPGGQYYGQCVSYVKFVTPSLPQTSLWKKGKQVKTQSDIKAGTVIATFDSDGKYSGHAAIYESQSALGINVIDQWITQPSSPIHRRLIRFGGAGTVNDGNNYFIVE
jgi:hypothetical protein